MMFLSLLFLVEATLAQMDREFWWLNEKVASLKGTHAPPVAYGGLNDLGTDTVIIKDHEVTENNEVVKDDSIKKTTKKLKEKKETNNDFAFETPAYKSVVYFPETETTRKNYDSMTQSSSTDELIFKDVVYYNTSIKNVRIIKADGPNFTDIDEIKLFFPITENTKSEHKLKNNSETNEHSITGDLQAIGDTNSKKQEKLKTNVENICTSLTINQCKQQKGTVYYKPVISTKHVNDARFTICCILPIIMKDNSSRMIFSDETNRRASRRKRGAQILNDKESLAKEKQRSFLLSIRLSALKKLTTSSVRPLQKIVTPDYEYEDPYWNIKNTKVGPVQDAQHDDAKTDYDEDFVSELPTPGKLGSHPKQSGKLLPFQWASSNRNIQQNGYNGDSYNDYGRDSIIDDRSENLKTDSSNLNVDDFISTEEDDEIDPFVSYTADPDFQVLEGFKLLNLIPKINIRSKNKIKPIKQMPNKFESESSQIQDSSDEQSALVKLYEGCDRKTVDGYDYSSDFSDETKPGPQPWLALIVLKARPRRILCYATLIHPRAAITAASCVHGSQLGEIELTIGQWDLNDDHLQPQRRTVNIYTDSNYRSNTLAHALALLYWNTPLRIDKNVNPICLTALTANDSCSLVGWGGKGQELLSRPRRERASLLKVGECNRRLYGRAQLRIPHGALCAIIESGHVLTDIGGALVCSRGDLQSLAAIVIWSESKPRPLFLLLPVNKWIKQAFEQIDIL